MQMRARVKQNLDLQTHKNLGGDLAKVIVKWSMVDGASSYEICRDCEFSAQDDYVSGTGVKEVAGAFVAQSPFGKSLAAVCSCQLQSAI